MICTNMKKILSHQVDLGPSMLDVKYKELGCNVSHAGIAHQHISNFFIFSFPEYLNVLLFQLCIHIEII